MPHVLITGASSGFGFDLAAHLAALGHRVFATMRDSHGRNGGARASLESLAARDHLAIDVLDVDVTDDHSARNGVADALDRAGHLDVVVNNAGIVTIGLTEAFEPGSFSHVFDVNVNGVVRVNRAVLPSMRARGEGLLIHLSSAAGRVVVPALPRIAPASSRSKPWPMRTASSCIPGASTRCWSSRVSTPHPSSTRP